MRDKIGDLTHPHGARLESLLLEFDKTWTPGSLSAALGQIPDDDQELRRIAVVELVRIDMEHWWSANRERTVEDYLAQLPELGTDRNVSPELIHAKYEIRRQCGKPVALSDIGQRAARARPESVYWPRRS